MYKFIVSVLLICLSSCSIKTHYIDTNSMPLEKTNPKEIKIYAVEDLDAEYTVIGSVASFTSGNGENAVDKLKEEAAKIGANAIIRFRLDKIDSFNSGTGASGTAVFVK